MACSSCGSTNILILREHKKYIVKYCKDCGWQFVEKISMLDERINFICENMQPLKRE